jgi:uncharacterized protein YndB with AHSA1/START domain
MKNQVLEKTITVNAPAAEVWKALTDPEMVKQYFFGTNLICNWQKGSPIKFTGEWEGKTYEDKGTILDIEPGKFVKYTYWSSFSGTEDAPENYANISYELEPQNGETRLTITQDNILSKEKYDHSDQNWELVLTQMKDLVERKVAS